jgi:Tfp pilus assembly PilM family ATPase
MFTGIDIGGRYTKIVMLDKKAKLSLVQAVTIATPYTADEQGFSKLDAAALFKSVDGLVPLSKLRVSKLAINLSTTSITTLSILLPPMAKKELFFAAINEAKQRMIPVSGPHHAFEAFSVGSVTQDGASKSAVMVVRIEKNYVDRILGMYKTFDIIPSLITPAAFVIPALLPPEAWKPGEDIAFVDIGATSLDIFIAHDGNLAFTRNVIYGLNDISKDLADKLGQTQEKIEQSIIGQYGVPKVDFDLSDKVALAEEIMRQKYEAMSAETTSETAINMLELRMQWQPHIERIVQELRRTFSYYKEQSSGIKVENIYFLGGGCGIKNLVSSIAHDLRGTTQALTPFRDIQVPADADQSLVHPIYANAVALAVGASHIQLKKQQLLNFLPQDIKMRESAFVWQWVLIIAVIVVNLLFGAGIFNLALTNSHIQRSLKQEQFDLKHAQSVIDKTKAISSQDATLNLQASRAKEIRSNTINFLPWIKDLAKAGRDPVVFDKLVLTEKDMEIQAHVEREYEEAEAAQLRFIKKIGETGNWFNITFVPVELEQISSQTINENDKLDLTYPRVRKFSIKAEAVRK